MDLHNSLTGRKEKRLPGVVVVNLAALERVNAERHERTYTDNINQCARRPRLLNLRVATWPTGRDYAGERRNSCAR